MRTYVTSGRLREVKNKREIVNINESFNNFSYISSSSISARGI